MLKELIEPKIARKDQEKNGMKMEINMNKFDIFVNIPSLAYQLNAIVISVGSLAYQLNVTLILVGYLSEKF